MVFDRKRGVARMSDHGFLLMIAYSDQVQDPVGFTKLVHGYGLRAWLLTLTF